jgi:lysophospholipid acyltransferase
MPIYSQYLYWTIACFGIRATFYVAWYLNDGSIAMSGLSYAGEDEEGISQFNKVECVDAFRLETCVIPRTGIQHWNSMTCDWLRYYVYERIKAERLSATSATIFTNLVSAFWHGFYPVYYSTFFLMALISEIGKDVYRLRHIFNVIPWPISSILANILIISSLNYAATGFMYLEMSKAFDAYSKHYYFGHIGLIGSFVILHFIMLPLFGKKKSKPKTE